LPLFDIQDVQIYSFQTGGGSEKLAQLAEKYSIIDISSELKDFSDTAAAYRRRLGQICRSDLARSAVD
jgi:hypothetical protein